MRTIHRSCHRCPFPKPPPPLLQATAVTPPGRKPIFHLPRDIVHAVGYVQCSHRLDPETHAQLRRLSVRVCGTTSTHALCADRVWYSLYVIMLAPTQIAFATVCAETS